MEGCEELGGSARAPAVYLLFTSEQQGSGMSSPAPDDADAIPVELHAPIQRAACEGIPVGAIGRIFAYELGEVYIVLNYLHSIGSISEVPKPDWPPTARDADRLPQFDAKPQASNLQFVAQRVFKLTKLEAGFLTALIRCEHADKGMLHGIIEQQRMQRQSRPNKLELTDPKMVDVMICKLRKKLRDHDAQFNGAVQTVWGGGYFIDPKTKAALLSLLADNGAINVKAEIANATANVLIAAARD
jgi:hypothetical protein